MFILKSRTFIWFSFILVMQMVLPLIALPWLSRKLGSEAFGLLMYMCLIPPIINLVMDWGLPLDAARRAARNKNSEYEIKQILGAVISCKIFLFALCFFGALILMPVLPYALSYPKIYFLAVFAGIARGINPFWFYQGTNKKIAELGIWDISANIITLALVFIFIQNPKDWGLYLLFIAVCKGFTYLYLNMRLWMRFRPSFVFKDSLNLLKHASPIFLSSSFNILYLQGAQLIMSYLLTPASLGIIVAISKMLKAVCSCTYPLTHTFFPKLCAISQHKPNAAKKVLLKSILSVFSIMLLGVLVIWICAPWIIRIALGDEYVHYGESVPVLRIIICSAPLLACNYALSAQALVAFGLEKPQAKVMGVGVILSLALSWFLAKGSGIIGAACVFPLMELFYFCAFFLLFWQRQKNVFKN